jgi:methionyl-tRNA formyltransferase
MVKKINPDLIISYNYKHIIKKDILNRYNGINLHISYLPYNKGAYPNIFSHINNTPKGVTVHKLNEKLDEGDILFQKKVVLNDNMTLKQSYKKLHFHIQQLFKANFYKKWYPKAQKKGNINYSKDLIKIKHCLTKGFDTTIKELKECYENRKN